jgi:nucleoid DNA-binding protein
MPQVPQIDQRPLSGRERGFLAWGHLVAAIAGTIVAEGEADIRGLGAFKRERTPAREGRNPRTGETIQIAAGYKVKFKAAKALRDRLPAAEQAEAAD